MLSHVISEHIMIYQQLLNIRNNMNTFSLSKLQYDIYPSGCVYLVCKFITTYINFLHLYIIRIIAVTYLLTLIYSVILIALYNIIYVLKFNLKFSGLS